MTKVAGIWETGWNTPIKEADLWSFLLREFMVDQFYMTPVSGIVHQFITERPTLEDVILENPDHSLVFVDEKAENVLKDFVHPRKALYLFGAVGKSPLHLLRPDVDFAVCIQTPMNSGMLWPHQAVAILLYDRMLKTWL